MKTGVPFDMASQRLTALTNKDKENHTVGGMLPGFPSRVGYFAAPSRGKRSACLNLIAREKPMFDTFTVVHIDPNTTEYSLLDDGDYKVIGFHQDGLPDPTSFDRSKKNCLILDELPFDSFSVALKSQLERLFNFTSIPNKSIINYITGRHETIFKIQRSKLPGTVPR